MWKIVRARLFQLVFVLLLLSTTTFALMKMAPGDPVVAILKTDQVAVTLEEEAALRKEMGFDQPVLEQYAHWLWGMVRLDLGDSYLFKRPVWEMILERLPVTVQMAAGGLVVMAAIAVPLGLLAARFPGRFPDHLSRLLALLGSSIPSFWLGLLLMYAFSYKLHWLPTMGTGTLRHMILPSLTLGLAMAAVYARLLRAGLLDA
ncbi:MAG: ABC transporter permease, partial [Tumebacillaceae bacterium]